MSIHRRGAWACALTCVAALAVLIGPVAQATHSSRLPFKPGHYAGYTSQTCPADPTPAGICQPGEKLPISFKVTGKSVSKLKVAILYTCEEGNTVGSEAEYRKWSMVHVTTEPRKWDINAKGRRAHMLDMPDVGIHSADVAHGTIIGTLHGETATGTLSSLLTVNAKSELDPTGDAYCDGRDVHWRASTNSNSEKSGE